MLEVVTPTGKSFHVRVCMVQSACQVAPLANWWFQMFAVSLWPRDLLPFPLWEYSKSK